MYAAELEQRMRNVTSGIWLVLNLHVFVCVV